MAIVITGAAGFVGSHLCDYFVSQGKTVVAVDNLLTGKLANLEAAISSGKTTFVYADVTMKPEELTPLLLDAAGGSIEAIYHLASPASPEAYSAHPWETLAVNGTATMNLIDLALAQKALMFFASTSEIYGDPLVHPQPEEYFGNVNPVGPRACYDEGKRFGEAAMSVAIEKRGLNGRIMRVFNCYGPRMDVGDGRVIPAFLAAMRDRTALPIHGDGMQTRSLTYIDDLIRGIVAVTNHRSPVAFPVNLGSEEEKTVLEIASAFCEVVGENPAYEYIPARPEDPRRRRPQTARARSIGWAAQTSLKDGLAKTWAWFLSTQAVYA